MLPIMQALVMGVVQGLTEFIPVSSSGHLVIIPELFGWPDLGQTFDVALHIGTVIALLAYFWVDWIHIITEFCRHIFSRQPYSHMPDGGQSGRLLVPIIVACVPTGLAGLLWDDLISENLRHWYLVAVPLVIAGLVMLAAEHIGHKNRSAAKMTYLDYAIIGLAQAAALFPGVSRSGATITAGLFLNLDRASAARFSFLLSMPIIVCAGLLKLAKTLMHGGIPASECVLFLVGMVAAAASGYAAIRFLMNYLRKHTLVPFALYRFGFVIIVALVFALRS